MAEIKNYLELAGFAGAVSQHTGSHKEGAKAAGYAAWVQSVTGDTPLMTRLPEGRVKLILSESQIAKMQDFFDKQVSGMISRKEPGAIDYGLSPAVKPWALRYALPAGVGILVVGYITGKIF